MGRMSRVLRAAMILGCTAGCDGVNGEVSQALPGTFAVKLTPVAAGFSSPTVITHAGDGSGRLFVAEQDGKVRITSSTGVVLPVPFLDISARVRRGGERGLLGLAFPPGFSSKQYFFVNYTRIADGATVVSRFSVSANPDLAEATSEQVILTVSQPFANHNGGQIAFGPDGMLYVGLGDGGAAGDPQNNGQNRAALLGKLLRLDVEAGVAPYVIPRDNPFTADPAARGEIWALGLRNPWRFSFDRLTGDLYVADVGQNEWEEIDFRAANASAGANFGWKLLEGPECYSPSFGCATPPGYSAPVAYYGHDLGCSVTGGYVYRGPGNSGMQGVYFYGDYCSGRLWGLRKSGSGWQTSLVKKTPLAISTFGEDESGRLYVTDYGSGTVYRIDEN